jgi:hypothetical protein
MRISLRSGACEFQRKASHDCQVSVKPDTLDATNAEKLGYHFATRPYPRATPQTVARSQGLSIQTVFG